jgi:hypothetical protein
MIGMFARKILSMKKTFFVSLIVMFITAGIVSCNNDNKNTTPPASSFAVINASPDAASLDVYLNGGSLVRNLTYGADTGYFTVSPGTYTLSFATTGTSTSLLDQGVSFAPGVTYSVFAIDSVNHLQTAVVTDSASIPSSDSVEVRFLNFSPNSPALDLAINGAVAFSNRGYNDIAANTSAAHFNYLAPGTYTVALRVAGSSVALYSTSVTLQGGKVYTLYAKGLTGDNGTASLSIGTVVHNE